MVEDELHRQRKIHDSLITMGLELISDCYLKAMDDLCQEQGLECERKMMDGKHSTEILKDIADSDYDLVVLGAVGIAVDQPAGKIGLERDQRQCAADHVVQVACDPLAFGGAGEAAHLLLGAQQSLRPLIEGLARHCVRFSP